MKKKKCVLLAGPLGLHQHLVQEKALLEKLFPQQGVLQKPTLALVVENFSCEIASGFLYTVNLSLDLPFGTCAFFCLYHVALPMIP